MGQTALYDRIGVGYRNFRRPDPRLAIHIQEALRGAQTVVNVGAGTGSYEPENQAVIAVEISASMIRQRPHSAARVVQASAMNLPFADKAFDAAMAILTIHHWPDRDRGLSEMKRISKGPCVVVTWEPPEVPFWLTEDYFPEILEGDRTLFPAWFREPGFKGVVSPLLVPADCTDGFMCAYWQRPEMYLNPEVRQAISAFCRGYDYNQGLERLESDLADGTWQHRNGHLMTLRELDLGYRLVVIS